MLYRTNPKNGESLSQLGLGCMRFPRKGGQIDKVKTAEMIDHAISRGINYFDTAYIYPGSEEALGQALQSLGKRDAVRIATKLPPYMCTSRADFDRIFNKQLERLRTDRIDYYLIHMLNDGKAWERLCSMGIEDWIARQKSSGKIINIGFSFHGGRKEFVRLIDAYGWEFCMVQYNYFDENNQASGDGVRYASGKGIPVFVMEPLRGGMLVNGLPKEAEAIFRAADDKRSLAAWGLSWLYNQPEITLVLSGMKSMQEIDENTALASDLALNHLREAEHDAYKAVVSQLNAAVRVPCTGCNYCMPCPYGVDIPTCFSAYNESYARSMSFGIRQYFMTTGAISTTQTNASKCKACGKCEKHCPQSIKIIEGLKKTTSRLESFWYGPITALARCIMLRTKKN